MLPDQSSGNRIVPFLFLCWCGLLLCLWCIFFIRSKGRLPTRFVYRSGSRRNSLLSVSSLNWLEPRRFIFTFFDSISFAGWCIEASNFSCSFVTLKFFFRILDDEWMSGSSRILDIPASCHRIHCHVLGTFFLLTSFFSCYLSESVINILCSIRFVVIYRCIIPYFIV